LRNGAVEHGRAAHPLAKFPRYRRGKVCIGRLPHHLQCLLDTPLGDHAQEGRLLQLYGQSLTQRSVEYRITRGIHEVGEDNGVLSVSTFVWRKVRNAIAMPATRMSNKTDVSIQRREPVRAVHEGCANAGVVRRGDLGG